MKANRILTTRVWGLCSLCCLTTAWAAQAQLVVKVEEPKEVGQKALLKLTLKNIFKEKVESARATLFLLDVQGKVVGQSTQWVIGGTKDKLPLAPESSTSYNFVVEAPKPFTNTKVVFSRIILEGGRVVDPEKNFEVVPK